LVAGGCAKPPLNVSCTVPNTGAVAGDEVVMVFHQASLFAACWAQIFKKRKDVPSRLTCAHCHLHVRGFVVG